MVDLRLRLVLLIVMLLSSTAAWAVRTDVVYLKNGDRVTGEVKGLDRGKLEFKTDHMGTLYIEWDNIDEITSNTGQALELTNGQRFHGALRKPDSSEMVAIETEQGTVGVHALDVVSIYPVDSGFWNRLDVSASLGFSWDKGSSVGRYNLGLEAEFRDPRFITRANLNTEITTQQGRENTKRASLGASHLVFKGNKQFVPYFGSVEKNDELGIDLRVLAGAGYGWVPIHSNRNMFSLAGGLAANREIPVAGQAETNLEAVAMMSYEYFKYSSPQRKFDVGLMVFPGLTDWGRWRANFDTNFRLELFSDLFWVLSGYASFDNKPISDEAAKSDYGATSSISYKF